MSARLRNLNPYDLHKYLVNIYCLNTKGSTTTTLARDTSRDRTDLDVVRENNKFVWEEDDIADTWEKQLAKKYYDKLFKEYCICDLSRYKENKVALRWRTEKEVVSGKGQFLCANKLCHNDNDLKSWELNFRYIEDNVKKNTLVKIRLCPECSALLNHKCMKREVKRLKKMKKSKKSDAELCEEKAEQGPQTPEDPQGPSTSAEAVGTESNDDSLWKKGVQEAEEKSREDEFEEYLDDLLL